MIKGGIPSILDFPEKEKLSIKIERSETTEIYILSYIKKIIENICKSL